MTNEVLYEVDGPAARITLNRPDKLNAMSASVVEGLVEAFAMASADDRVKVVVVSGAGRAFCSGYDLAEDAGANDGEDGDGGGRTADSWHYELQRDVDMTMTLWTLPKPTIAKVHGWCLAGGCELAMACDVIVAADDARFGEPEIRYGSGPATLLMPHMIGIKRSALLLFTGDAIDAVEAERIGLVSRVVPRGELDDAVTELVAKLAPTPLAVLRYTKLALLRAADAMGLAQAVSANLDLSAILNGSDSPEQREFDQIVARDGLKAALSWRDSRYGELSS